MKIKKSTRVILSHVLILCGFFTPHTYAMHEGNENLQQDPEYIVFGHEAIKNLLQQDPVVAGPVIEFEVNENENSKSRFLSVGTCTSAFLALCCSACFGKRLYDGAWPFSWYLAAAGMLPLMYVAMVLPEIKKVIKNTYSDAYESRYSKAGDTANFRRFFYRKKLKVQLRAAIDKPLDKAGNTMLMLSVKTGRFDDESSLGFGMPLKNMEENRLVEFSRANCCLELLKKGANVNSSNRLGATALMNSLETRFGTGTGAEQVRVVRSLLIAGADVSAAGNGQRNIFEKIASAEAEYSTWPAIVRNKDQGCLADLQTIKELCKNPQLAFDSATQQEKAMFKARFPDRPFKYVPASLDEALLLYNRFDNRQALLTYLRETYDIFKAFADTKGDDKNVSPEFRVDTPLANEIFSNLDLERTEKLKAALEKADKCGHRELVTCLKAYDVSYARPQPTEWTSFNDELHAYDTVLPAVPVHVKERSVMNCQKME